MFKRLKRKDAAVRCILFLFLALPMGMVGCTSKRRELQRAVVVEVNDRKLQAKEFADNLATKLKQFDALSVKDPNTLNRVKEQIIRQFIVESITEEWADKNKIQISPEELDKEVASVRANYPDDLSFRRALAAENLPFEEWTRHLRNTLLQKKVAKKLVDDISPPSEEDQKKYYEANPKEFETPERIRLIQLVVGQENDAKRLYAEVKKDKGATLGVLARKFSIAPESNQDGDTGWIDKGTLPIFDRAFALPIGGLSPILKSPYGYHIYKVAAKQGNSRMTYAQARDVIGRHLSAQREKSIFSSWLESQIKAAKVRRNEAVISSISVETRDN